MNTSTKTFTVADTAANADYLTNTSEPLGETMTLNVGPTPPPPPRGGRKSGFPPMSTRVNC